MAIKHEEQYSPDYFLLLNNDTIVILGFLTKLISTFDDCKYPNVGIVSGLIRYYIDKENV